MLRYDSRKVIDQIVRETELPRVIADVVAKKVVMKIATLQLSSLSGPLIRELVGLELLEMGYPDARRKMTRVGLPVHDANLIDVGTGFEAKDNANLQENAETSHKKKADKISKEQYLLQLPQELSDAHLSGDIHIHDLQSDRQDGHARIL